MNIADRIRAWKDPVFRASLESSDMTQLHDNPAGMIELTGTALDLVSGGGGKSKCKGSGKSSKSKKSCKSKKSSKSKRSSRSRGSRGSGRGC